MKNKTINVLGILVIFLLQSCISNKNIDYQNSQEEFCLRISKVVDFIKKDTALSYYLEPKYGKVQGFCYVDTLAYSEPPDHVFKHFFPNSKVGSKELLKKKKEMRKFYKEIKNKNLNNLPFFINQDQNINCNYIFETIQLSPDLFTFEIFPKNNNGSGIWLMYFVQFQGENIDDILFEAAIE